jgi:hypothetical protein
LPPLRRRWSLLTPAGFARESRTLSRTLLPVPSRDRPRDSFRYAGHAPLISPDESSADLDAHCRCLLPGLTTDRSRPPLPAFVHRQPNSLTTFVVLLPALFRCGTLGQTRVGFPLLCLTAGPLGVPGRVVCYQTRCRRLRLERFRSDGSIVVPGDDEVSVPIVAVVFAASSVVVFVGVFGIPHILDSVVLICVSLGSHIVALCSGVKVTFSCP